MKVLLLHNYYRQPGGEDQVFAAEKALLKERGCEVFSVTFHNRDLEIMPLWRKAVTPVWNEKVYRECRRLLREKQPQVVHVHNTFPLASPAIVHAAHAEGIPVVMTLHNYRLLCPNALLFRNGKVCEACLKKTIPLPGVIHGCWRGRAPSTMVMGMLAFHRLIKTWDRVQRFIALTGFARKKFIEGGLPPDRIAVKPNFVHPDPGGHEHPGRYALYVGRLSPEKGIRTLLEAWHRLNGVFPLKIVGDGALAPFVTEAVEHYEYVEYLGRRTSEEVRKLMREAAFLVFPSGCYEGFPLVLAEAFGCGLPVVATALGSQGSIVEHGRTGLHFRAGDAEQLADRVRWLFAHPDELARMRREARAEYEMKYTAERNYERLMAIYEQARAQKTTGP